MVAKLERVALREAFPSEVKDLSRWVQWLLLADTVEKVES
jgi:hypothetical protein